jgi:hypothetical protein
MSKLAILYTDNAFPEILNLSLEKLSLISTDVRIIVCANKPIENNKFEEIIVNNPIRNHYNIIEKILAAINHGQSTGDYKYVSFLEHDVLYPQNYFDYPDFKDAIINDNYIGMCKDGFQNKLPCQLPLHQMTMEITFALQHFNKLLEPSKTRGVEVEPKINNRYYSNYPAVHINHGRNFTSHFNCYGKIFTLHNSYWKDHKPLWDRIKKAP